MTYFLSFVFCGSLCLIAQLIIDNTKLSAGHVTSMFVVIGAALDIFDIYDKIIEKVGGGALIPITSFGHLLVHGAMDMAGDIGIMGLTMGAFNLTAAGITVAIFLSFVLALIFKPKH